MKITTIGFDADDTLWHNQSFYSQTKAEMLALLAQHGDPAALEALLLAAERRNVQHYGYGVKSFTLSLIETAIEASGGTAPAQLITEIMAAGRALLAHPVELLPHAADAVETLHRDFRLVLITKGDLLHQERKLEKSGLAPLFHGVEIVTEKTAQTYATSFARHGHGPERALMVGNSLKSDVLPALEAGGWGVHVPHGETWALEHADAPDNHPRYHELVDLGGLPGLIESLGQPD